MEQMPPPLPHKAGVEATCQIYSPDTDQYWPLELVWTREDNRCYVRGQFKEVLEGCFDAGEGSPVLGFDFLFICQIGSTYPARLIRGL
jgi:hypothetical protein